MILPEQHSKQDDELTDRSIILYPKHSDTWTLNEGQNKIKLDLKWIRVLNIVDSVH